MNNKGSLKGIGLFSHEIVHLISSGKKETIAEIEKHFQNEDVVEYLFGKYKNIFSTRFDIGTYNNAAINKYFSDYCSYIEGNEDRKYGIENETDGLLLILALIADKVEMAATSWTIEM